MKTLPRLSLCIMLSLLALLMMLLSLVSQPAQADVGVRPILPGGSNIQPEDETPIQMAAETIEMTVRPATESDNAVVVLNPKAYGLDIRPIWFSAIAEVQADFTMLNPTGEAVSMTAWFPLASALQNVGWELNPDEIVPSIESFMASVDGNPVDYITHELPNPQGADRPLLPWASFPVTFPAGTETRIDVSYLLPLQHSLKGNELALYYIFQTGAGWAGPIGQVELILDLPYPASEETLAGITPGSLSLPYFVAASAGQPIDGVMQGNQVRWTWQDFEPGPQDDFAIWLIDLDKWQVLETARSAVHTNPEDGQAWLDLAAIYYSLSTTGYNQPSVFGAIYQPLGMTAFQKAADLLPEHPAPHTGLALLTLSPYMPAREAPPEVLQAAQDELARAKELETKHPAQADEAGLSSWMVEESLSIFFYNDATATVESALYSTEWARETELAEQMSTPSATPGQPATLTPVPPPSATSLPAPTTLSTPIENPAAGNNSMSLVILTAAGAIALLVIGYFIMRRMRS